MRLGALAVAAGVAASTIGAFGNRSQIAVLAFGFAVALVWIGLEAARRFYPVFVGDKGLHAYDWRGAYYTVEWDRITACRRDVMFPWLSYLCIRVDDQANEVMVPTYLEHYGRFRELVLSNAPAENPLSQFLTQGSDLARG